MRAVGAADAAVSPSQTRPPEEGLPCRRRARPPEAGLKSANLKFIPAEVRNALHSSRVLDINRPAVRLEMGSLARSSRVVEHPGAETQASLHDSSSPGDADAQAISPAAGRTAFQTGCQKPTKYPGGGDEFARSHGGIDGWRDWGVWCDFKRMCGFLPLARPLGLHESPGATRGFRTRYGGIEYGVPRANQARVRRSPGPRAADAGPRRVPKAQELPGGSVCVRRDGPVL